jgi:hypothetical protein
MSEELQRLSEQYLEWLWNAKATPFVGLLFIARSLSCKTGDEGTHD